MAPGSFLIGSLVLMTVMNRAAGAPAMTADEWREDLDFLVDKLTTVHPVPYHRTSKEAFDRDVAALRQDIPHLNDYEVAVRMMQLTALLGDGHTGLDPTGDVVAFDHWFPVRIERFEDGWFVTATTKAQSDLVGAEVVRVGSLPHSKMSLNVSVFSWDLGAAPWDVRDRVQPELLAPPRAESYFAGRDSALEAVERYSTSPGLVGRMLRAFEQGGVAAALALLDRQRAERPEGLWNAYEYES